MANINQLTNASGGGGASAPNVYYNASIPNYGEYGFVFLQEIVDNFTAAYTGTGKILANVMKGDINFHAHRALQELSYDTLVSHKSQEIEVCPSLKMPLPHNYVNYVKLTSVDSKGIEHIIYPTKHTSNPFPISQASDCSYDTSATFLTQQTGESNTWENYSTGSNSVVVPVTGGMDPAIDNSSYFTNTGERYGLAPEHAQVNGSFFIDYALGNIHFSSALAGKTVILKYISDGHATEDEMMVPKLAEEAMYKWIAYGCAQARTDVDPNTVVRLKKEKIAETRKAKLRLSNIKLEEISQIFRNKSKWIKH
tara:strand:- start:3843 stop:4772 length:930 start_codon:yes stop_codon:yes gene_type:complete